MLISRLLAFLLASLPNLMPAGFAEPSGLAWHEGRATLVVVGDEGQVAELTATGELAGEITAFAGPHCHRDFEAVAVDPRTGHLLVAVEPTWEILALDPESREVVGRYAIPDAPEPCSDTAWGIEGLAVLGPDPEREGWLLATAARQGRPALILELSLPPLGGPGEPVLLATRDAPVSSVSDLTYGPAGALWVLEGFRGRLHRFVEGEAAGVFFLPFPLAEGLAFTPDGALWIADDTGGVYRLGEWRQSLPERPAEPVDEGAAAG